MIEGGKSSALLRPTVGKGAGQVAWDYCALETVMLFIGSALAAVALGFTPATAVAQQDQQHRQDRQHRQEQQYKEKGCNSHACDKRVRRRLDRHVRWRRTVRFMEYWHAVPLAVRTALRTIALCESHGNPRAISAGGAYRGKYQFSFSTWRTVGGVGDPAAALEIEQDNRAARLFRTGGPHHWPICGQPYF
jgi:hypothetical protein